MNVSQEVRIWAVLEMRRLTLLRIKAVNDAEFTKAKELAGMHQAMSNVDYAFGMDPDMFATMIESVRQDIRHLESELADD